MYYPVKIYFVRLVFYCCRDWFSILLIPKFINFLQRYVLFHLQKTLDVLVSSYSLIWFHVLSFKFLIANYVSEKLIINQYFNKEKNNRCNFKFSNFETRIRTLYLHCFYLHLFLPLGLSEIPRHYLVTRFLLSLI